MSYIMNKCGNYIPLFLFFLKFTSVSLPLSLSAFLYIHRDIGTYIYKFWIGTVISNVMGYFIFLELRHLVNMFQYLLLLSNYTFNFLSFGMCWQLSSLSTISKDWKEFTHLKHQSPSEHESSLVQRSCRLVHNLSPTVNAAYTFTQHTNLVINWIRETFLPNYILEHHPDDDHCGQIWLVSYTFIQKGIWTRVNQLWFEILVVTPLLWVLIVNSDLEKLPSYTHDKCHENRHFVIQVETNVLTDAVFSNLMVGVGWTK